MSNSPKLWALLRLEPVTMFRNTNLITCTKDHICSVVLATSWNYWNYKRKAVTFQPQNSWIFNVSQSRMLEEYKQQIPSSSCQALQDDAFSWSFAYWEEMQLTSLISLHGKSSSCKILYIFSRQISKLLKSTSQNSELLEPYSRSDIAAGNGHVNFPTFTRVREKKPSSQLCPGFTDKGLAFCPSLLAEQRFQFLN